MLAKMNEYYHEHLLPASPPGSVFIAKPPGCTITAYTSGKVLFQGKNHDAEAKKWGIPSEERPLTESKRHAYSPPANIHTMSIIGTDEVGTGDYFGPITVVAAYVAKEQIATLKELGVKDSKHLSDTQICSIAEKILPIVPYSLLILHNEKYNDIQQKGMSQGKMKALLHNQAINHLLKKIPDNNIDGILIDQFTLPETYFQHIKGKEQLWTGRVYFSTKAESVHLAVAAASIIARYSFVKQFDKLSEKAGFPLQKGAGPKVDEVAAKLLNQHGEKALYHFAKLHFANTEKAKKILQRK